MLSHRICPREEEEWKDVKHFNPDNELSNLNMVKAILRLIHKPESLITFVEGLVMT